jgi:hypothetical protein
VSQVGSGSVGIGIGVCGWAFRSCAGLSKCTGLAELVTQSLIGEAAASVFALTAPGKALEGIAGICAHNPNAAAAAAAAAGAKFFPGFMTDSRRSALDAAALAWQAEGKAQLNTLARVSLGQDQAILIPPAGVWGMCWWAGVGRGNGEGEGGGANLKRTEGCTWRG